MSDPSSSAPHAHSMLETAGALVLVGAIWGCTNPFIKRGTKGIVDVKSTTRLGQFYEEVLFLISNWQYVVPFVINQIGSVVYYLTLGSVPLSLAVPVANSLTFVFTAVTGWLIGEEPLTKRNLLGILLIVAGTTLCYMDKS